MVVSDYLHKTMAVNLEGPYVPRTPEDLPLSEKLCFDAQWSLLDPFPVQFRYMVFH